MHRRRRLALIALSLVVAAAFAGSCSSSDVEQPGDGGRTGSSPPIDGGTSDALDDKNATSDASTGFCANRDALACADFTNGGGGLGFERFATNNAVIQLDRALLVSPPNSVRIKANAVNAGNDAHALLVYSRPSVPEQLVATASFYVNEVDPASVEGLYLLAIRVEGGAFAYVTVTNDRRCSLRVRGVGPDAGTEQYDCQPFPFQAWARVRLAVTFPDRADLTIDGSPVLSQRILNFGGFNPGPGTYAGVEVGLISVGPSATQEILIDDILVE